MFRYSTLPGVRRVEHSCYLHWSNLSMLCWRRIGWWRPLLHCWSCNSGPNSQKPICLWLETYIGKYEYYFLTWVLWDCVHCFWISPFNMPIRKQRDTGNSHMLGLGAYVFGSGALFVCRSVSVSNVMLLFIVLYILSRLRPAPWAYETVWTVLQSLLNLHTCCMPSEQQVVSVHLIPQGNPQCSQRLSMVRFTTGTATEFDPSIMIALRNFVEGFGLIWITMLTPQSSPNWES